MKEEMQKTGNVWHVETGTESRCTHGVQTCMGIIENNLVEVPIVGDELLTHILSPINMNLAYKRVVGYAGRGGIDGMEVKELLPYLRSHNDELVKKLLDGKYRPNPVRRVEIPKDNGKKRPLGIPTVVDRLVQQSIAQVLQPLYEPQFSPNSFGFRPHRGAHQSLRCAQSIINDGNRFCIDLDLEQFFDNVNHDKTGTGSVCGKKFLSYTFYFDKDGKCQLRLHAKTIAKLKAKLRELTGRSNGMGYTKVRTKKTATFDLLRAYYYCIPSSRSFCCHFQADFSTSSVGVSAFQPSTLLALSTLPHTCSISPSRRGA